MNRLLEAHMDPNDIRDLFKTIIAIRGKGKSYQKKAKDLGSGFKQKFKGNEDLDRVRALAGLHEGPLDKYTKSRFSRFKQGAQDMGKNAARAATDFAYKTDKRNVYNKFTDRGAVDVDTLYDAWEDANRPTDTREIVQLLQANKFTDREIRKAFTQLELDPNAEPSEKVTKLASAIVKAGLTDDILSYLKMVSESVITERTLSNKSIKAVFSDVVDDILNAQEVSDDDYPEPPTDEPLPTQEKPRVRVAATSNTVEGVDFRNRKSLYEFFSNIINPPLGRKRKL